MAFLCTVAHLMQSGINDGCVEVEGIHAPQLTPPKTPFADLAYLNDCWTGAPSFKLSDDLLGGDGLKYEFKNTQPLKFEKYNTN